MEDIFILKINEKTCEFLSKRALFFDEEKVLVLSDLHVGKLGYFRKKGIPLPGNGMFTTLENLAELVDQKNPELVIFLGDLFHTGDDTLWQQFIDVLQTRNHATHFMLIQGNHDVFPPEQYAEAGLLYQPEYQWGNIIFTHEPLKDVPADQLNIAGHIHPAIRLVGRGRQSMRLPCFYLAENVLLLPPFGHFTGYKTIVPREGEEVWAIVDGRIVHLPGSKHG